MINNRASTGNIHQCGGCSGKLERRISCTDGYEVYWCAKCGIGVTAPFPADGVLCSLYSTGAYRANDGGRFIPLVELFIRLFRNRHRDRIVRRIAPGRILDIGCGRGTFLASMRSAGWEVLGVEYNDETAGYARMRYGMEVVTDIPSVKGLFDVVTLNHVIEHLPDPGAMLAVCRGLLKEGGVLVVAAPNFESLQARFGGADWFHLDVPYHLHHLSERWLVRMVKSAGFELERVRRFDFEHNLFGWIQTLFNRMGFRRNALYDFLKDTSTGRTGVALPVAVAMLLLLAPVTLLSYLLSVLESVLHASGTVEVRAKAVGNRDNR